MREIFALSAIAQGTVVIMSYIIYFPEGNLWAGLNDKVVFALWCVTSSLSAVGFISFSLHLVYWVDDSSAVYFLTIFPYATFLASSACYMPFATSGMKPHTLFVLFWAAASACALLYCSLILLGASWVTYLMGVLAFHCSVIDLIFWGFTWTTDDNNSQYI